MGTPGRPDRTDVAFATIICGPHSGGALIRLKAVGQAVRHLASNGSHSP